MVSGSKTLAARPLSPGSCEVGPSQHLEPVVVFMRCRILRNGKESEITVTSDHQILISSPLSPSKTVKVYPRYRVQKNRLDGQPENMVLKATSIGSEAKNMDPAIHVDNA